MGNGGCNCNVRNIDMVEKDNSKTKDTINKIKTIKSIKLIKCSQINTDSVYNFDLEDFNDEFMKKYEIGKYFMKCPNSFVDNSLRKMCCNYHREIEKMLTAEPEEDELKILKKLKSKEEAKQQKSDCLIEKVKTCSDYTTNHHQSNLSRKIKNISDEKLICLFHFLFDNEFRIVLYNIFLPSFTMSNNDELLLLKETQSKIKQSEILFKNENGCNVNSMYQIELDVPRTFPQLPIFKEKSFCDNLRFVLKHVSEKDQELDYVQGMNFTSAYFLILSGNNKSLCLNFFLRILNIKSLIFSLSYRDTLTPEFPLLFKYLALIRSKFSKQVKDLIAKYEIDDFLWISKWIQTLFTHKFKFEIVVKLHDIIVINGLDYLVLIILAIVEFFNSKILKIKSLEDFLKLWEDVYLIKGYTYSSFIVFILNKIKTKEYKNILLQ